MVHFLDVLVNEQKPDHWRGFAAQCVLKCLGNGFFFLIFFFFFSQALLQSSVNQNPLPNHPSFFRVDNLLLFCFEWIFLKTFIKTDTNIKLLKSVDGITRIAKVFQGNAKDQLLKDVGSTLMLLAEEDDNRLQVNHPASYFFF